MTTRRLILLVVEDNDGRVDQLNAWLSQDFRLLHAPSAGQAIGILKRDRGRAFAGVLLDHDLGDQARTQVDSLLSGRDVVQAVIDALDTDTPVLVHSMNPTRAPAMVERLQGAGFWVERIPFANLNRERFCGWLEHVRDAWPEPGADT